MARQPTTSTLHLLNLKWLCHWPLVKLLYWGWKSSFRIEILASCSLSRLCFEHKFQLLGIMLSMNSWQPSIPFWCSSIALPDLLFIPYFHVDLDSVSHNGIPLWCSIRQDLHWCIKYVKHRRSWKHFIGWWKIGLNNKHFKKDPNTKSPFKGTNFNEKGGRNLTFLGWKILEQCTSNFSPLKCQISVLIFIEIGTLKDVLHRYRSLSIYV